MTRPPKRALCGAALIAVLLLQPVVGSLCAAVCGSELAAALRERPAAAPSHCGGEEERSDADRHPCEGHAKIRSSAASRKAPPSGGREMAAALHSPASAEIPPIRQTLLPTHPVPHPSHAPPGRAVLRL